MPNYLFDVKMFASIRLDAPDEQTARQWLQECLNCATGNLGALPNSEPIVCEISLDGELDLVEVDGECQDGYEAKGSVMALTPCPQCGSLRLDIAVKLEAVLRVQPHTPAADLPDDYTYPVQHDDVRAGEDGSHVRLIVRERRGQPADVAGHRLADERCSLRVGHR